MDIIDLLASDNFIMCNKTFAKKYGIEESILLGVMCSYQKGFQNEEFYREQEKILDDTALTLYSLRKAMKTLQSLGILSITKKGLPAKHYYKINTDNLVKCLSSRPIENDSTGYIENDSTNNNYYKNNCNKENIKESSENTNFTSSIMVDLNNESPSSKPLCTNEGKTIVVSDQADKKTQTLSLDSAKEKEIEDIYNYWNSLGRPTHKALTGTFVKAIKKALKTYSVEEIKKAILNYKTVLNDKDYYFNYIWGLDTFLKQGNCLPHFVDDGEKWLNYCSKKGINPKQRQTYEVKEIKKGLFTY